MDQADCFLWLDIDWPICRDRLLQRSSGSNGHMAWEESEQDLREILDWASCYYKREDPRLHSGHKALIEQFEGETIHLRSEADVAKMIATLSKYPE
jgi:hypothetical protein